MTPLHAHIEGIGYWSHGLPSWQAAQDYAHDGRLPEAAPTKPSPQLLAPNERRRAPETVAVALEVALAACAQAAREPASMSSIFASTHGDLAITDYVCSTLASAPRTISPTRFHNSVHNAAAGYWTIGAGCMQPATALSAYDCSFAQALLEAMVQLATGCEAVLLVGYDSQSVGPLARISPSQGLLGGALVLANQPRAGSIGLRVHLADGADRADQGPLSSHSCGNAMAHMLPLFDALAARRTLARLKAGPGRVLQLEMTHD